MYGPCSQEFGPWDCGTSNSYAGVGQFSTDLVWFRALFRVLNPKLYKP